jgi:hypothetical protein
MFGKDRFDLEKTSSAYSRQLRQSEELRPSKEQVSRMASLKYKTWSVDGDS